MNEDQILRQGDKMMAETEAVIRRGEELVAKLESGDVKPEDPQVKEILFQPRLAKSTDHQIDGLVAAIAQEDRATVHAFQHGQTILQFPLQGIGITVIRHIPRILIRVQKNGGIPMKLITCG